MSRPGTQSKGHFVKVYNSAGISVTFSISKPIFLVDRGAA